jgi:DNA-binding response OmpR family regulator
MRVLLAEDDPDMLDVTTYALRRYGFTVTGVSDGASALERWHVEQPDLVLLDVNLPDLNGMEVCRQIRAEGTTPIIMVTALNDEVHLVEGLESGADDYVTKPVSYRALATRMRTILRRHTGVSVLPTRMVAESAGVRVDLESHEVTSGGLPIRLTRLETRILYFLVSNAGHVVPTERLIQLVWNYEGGDSFALKTHVSHIRTKLGLRRGQPGYISALQQVGYTFETATRR